MFLALSVSVGVWLFVSGCGRLSGKGLFLCNGKPEDLKRYGELYLNLVGKKY